MKIQLWSIYYEPCRMGVAPVAASLARELVLRGHEVTVVASHPHYPAPDWGTSWRVHREVRDGVNVIEIPVYPRRDTAIRRALEELTYAVGQGAGSLRLPDADALITTIPSVMALPTAEAFSRRRGIPWVIWLQDMISDAAAMTGLINNVWLERFLARIEQRAYASASGIVSISNVFRDALVRTGVPEERIERIYLPPGQATDSPSGPSREPRVVVIGNIGLTQNLPAFVDAFQRSPALSELGATLHITGDGVEAPAVRDAVDSGRVSVLGLVSPDELDRELRASRVALVSQRPEIRDINLPSKLTTYMSYGLPVFGSLNPESEAARLIESSGAGWVADSADLDAACGRLAEVLRAEGELERASAASRRFADENFDPAAMAARFEGVIERVANGLPANESAAVSASVQSG